MLSSAFAYLNRTILHCFASSRRRLQRKAEKRKNQGKSAGNILSPIKQKRKKEHTGGKSQQTEKAEAVEKPETKGKQ